MAEKDIEEIKKGVSFKIKPVLPEDSEYWEVHIECVSPGFMKLVKRFATSKTKEQRVGPDLKFERYAIKTLVSEGLLEPQDTIVFEKSLVDTNKTVLKGLTGQALQEVKRSFDRVPKLLEIMVAILLEEEKDRIYSFEVSVKAKQ